MTTFVGRFDGTDCRTRRSWRDRNIQSNLSRQVLPSGILCGKEAGEKYRETDLQVLTALQPIQTVESLEQGGRLDPLQQSFIEHDAPQCGYCTSGQLMSAHLWQELAR